MKKMVYVAVLALAMTACGNGSTKTEANEVVATDTVPAAATEVLPAAAPGPDAGGEVATEVVPAEAAK